MDDVITLLTVLEWTVDGVGNQTAKVVEREVWARIESVTRAEFSAGGEQGLKPDIMAVICRFDYQGEEEAIYSGVRYDIYRTFAPSDSDRIELYLTRRRGKDVYTY